MREWDLRVEVGMAMLLWIIAVYTSVLFPVQRATRLRQELRAEEAT